MSEFEAFHYDRTWALVEGDDAEVTPLNATMQAHFLFGRLG